MIFKLNCCVSKIWKTQQYSLKKKICLLLLGFLLYDVIPLNELEILYNEL